MPRYAASLTDARIRAFKKMLGAEIEANAKLKERFLGDGRGLFLKATTAGAMHWIFRYTYEGRQRTIAFENNEYPGMSLKLARDAAERFREMLARGEDPKELRKSEKVERRREAESVELEAKRKATTFKAVAEEWFERHLGNRSPATQRNGRLRLQKHIYPWIGARPIDEITAPEILKVVERIAQQGRLDSASRLLRRCGQVFRYAVATARATRDVTFELKGALAPAVETHRAAITDPREFGVLLNAIDGYQGWFATHYALRILPLVFTRPGELRLAEWSEFDFERAQWDVPSGRMKMRNPHTVPLSRQVVALLMELRQLSGEGRFLFPSPRQQEKPISDMAMLVGLRRLGYEKGEVSPHGFRASARTLLDERLRKPHQFIEAQLAHKVADALGNAYNRTQYLDDRKVMMQEWADYLDRLKAGAVG